MLFNLGPFEIVVLIIVGLVVFGPERLPELAKDAARMIKTLRDLAQGARTQLRDELGPGVGDLDLRSLNPRVALQKVLFDDEDEPINVEVVPNTSTGATALDLDRLKVDTVDLDKPVTRPVNPLGRAETAPYDADAT